MTLFGKDVHAGVLVHASSWQESVSATTDATGAYTLTGLAAGYNVVTFRKDGFEAAVRDVVVRPDGVAGLGETMLFATGSVVGRVLRPDGSPAANAIVFICQSNPPSAQSGITKFITDASGSYEASSVNPGFHQITSFLQDDRFVGEGPGGAFGITVIVHPGTETVAEDMKLRAYDGPSSGLARSGCE